MVGQPNQPNEVGSHSPGNKEHEEDVPSSSFSSKASSSRTLANLIKAFIGAGILSLPTAFSQSGIILGLATMLIVALLSEYCTRLLFYSKRYIEQNQNAQPNAEPLSFQTIGQHCLGTFGYYLVLFFLFFTQVGFCTAYTIFIATNSDDVYSFFPEKTSTLLVHDLSLALWVLIWLPVLLLVNWIKDMKYLAITSLIGEVTLAFGFISILVVSFLNLSGGYEGGSVSYALYSTFALFFGTAVYAFEGIGIMIPVMNSMRYPESFWLVLRLTYFICFMLFCVFGLSLYYIYGSDLQQISTITSILPPTPITDVIKFSLCIGLACTHPIQMYPVFQIIESGFGWNTIKKVDDEEMKVREVVQEEEKHEEEEKGEKEEADKAESVGGEIDDDSEKIGKFFDLKRNAMRSGLVATASIIAILVPNFQNFVGLIGSIGCSTLAFALPALFYWRTCPDISILMKLVCTCILIFSLVAMGLCATLNTIQLIDSFR